jgi:hypothetical protein
MVNIFMENLKDKGFRDVEKSICKIHWSLRRELSWRRHEVFISNTKKLSK